MRSGDLNKRITTNRDSRGCFIKGHLLSDESIAKMKKSLKGRPSWAKGLTKETDSRIAMSSEKMRITKTGKKIGPQPSKKGIRVSIATEFKKGHLMGHLGTKFKPGCEHPGWKGGITPEHDKIRHSKSYKQWRLAVYRRDRYHCQTCQKHCEQKDIIAHHIKSFADHEHLRFIVENGITLCRGCHINLHRNEDGNLCAAAI